MVRNIIKINVDKEFEAWTTQSCKRKIYLGCAANQMKILSELGYNEFIVTNIDENLSSEFFHGLSLAVRTTNYPITVTGNIQLEDVTKLRDCGADRIFVGSHKAKDERMVNTVVDVFGMQSFGCSLIIDTKNLVVRTSTGDVISQSISRELDFISTNKVCSEVLIHSWLDDGLEKDSKEYAKLQDLLKDHTHFPFIIYGGTGQQNDSHIIRSTTACTFGTQSLIQPSETLKWIKSK